VIQGNARLQKLRVGDPTKPGALHIAVLFSGPAAPQLRMAATAHGRPDDFYL
jgi:hypothetical protein